MAVSLLVFYCVYILKMFMIVEFADTLDALKLNMNLTRQEITAQLGHAVNLGCYVTTPSSSSLTYSWSKGNRSVTQSSRVNIFDNVLVVTPKNISDFGTYVCSASNGPASISCRILLVRGWNKTDTAQTIEESAKGCVNISVLMPILAVAVISVLLNIHLLIERRRRGRLITSQENEVRLTTNVVVADEQPEEHVEKRERLAFKCFKKRRRVKNEGGRQNQEKKSDHEEIVDVGREPNSDKKCVEMDGEMDSVETSEEREPKDGTSRASTEEDTIPAETETPKLAAFSINDGASDGDEAQQSGGESLDSDAPLVSHYIEQMDFEERKDTERPIKQ